MDTVLVKQETLRSIQFIGVKNNKSNYLERILNLFESQASSILAQVDEALAHSDTKKVLHLAHSLKGSAMCIGAMKLAQNCSELEELIRSDSKMAEMLRPLSHRPTDQRDSLLEKIASTHQVYQQTLDELRPFFSERHA